MTHDLIKNVLTGLDAMVHKIVVTELKDDTFYAVIWLEREGHVVSIDSRPSDALALALRVDCPIFVEDEVLKNSKQAANPSLLLPARNSASGWRISATTTWASTRCRAAVSSQLSVLSFDLSLARNLGA